MHGVLSRDPSNQLLSRTSRMSGHKRYRVVRVDTSVVESTKNIVEWKNASHEGDLERLRTLHESRGPSNQLSSRTSGLQRTIIGVRFGDRPPA